MGVKIELKGKMFGRLKVIAEDTTRTKQGHIKWICKCECGKEVSVFVSNLRNGNTKSCGCLQKEIVTKLKTSHGLKKHPLYQVWHDMIRRCNNPKATGYARYGSRGIQVYDRWLSSVENFTGDMEGDYKNGLQLDRIDNDKGYSKDNCRWVTRSQNLMNTRAHVDSSSKYKGVCWDKSRGKWIARIRQKIIGRFICEKEAALAYNKAASRLLGEYAYLNKIEG